MKKLKQGWNWRYNVQSEGGETIIEEEAWLKTTHDERKMLSPYPYGDGRREDAVCDEIRGAFRELHTSAREDGVEVRNLAPGRWGEVRWLISTDIDSTVVSDFIKSLRAINRVDVIIKK